ncbi:MAG: hypothetical protein Q9183_003558 [Haloplaca sp. 2 TL-2023]
MAASQRRLSSQGSSSVPSRACFTPSETRLSDGEAMVDNSNPGSLEDLATWFPQNLNDVRDQRLEANLSAHHYVTWSPQPPSTKSLRLGQTPRYIASNQELGLEPWTSLHLHPEQGGLVQEVLYDSLLTAGSWTNEHTDALFQDRYVYDETLMESNNNIDPPASPDPVGPPVEVNHLNYQLSSNAHDTVVGTLLDGRGHAQERTTGDSGSCWDCVLQRVKCKVKSEREGVCIGSSLAQQGDPRELNSFTLKRVSRWLNNHMEVRLTWGCFEPIRQYRLDCSTGQYDLVQVPSPPLGMILMAFPERQKRLLEYLDLALEERYFRGFLQRGFRGNECLVEQDLLGPIFTYYNALEHGKSRTLVNLALRLIVLTYFMTHSLTLVENTKEEVFERLQNRPPNAFGIHTSPRFLNKQIKTILAAIHYDVLRIFLNKFQEGARLSNKTELWAAMFISIFVLASTTDTLEATLRCKEETDKGENEIDESDTTAEKAIWLMEESFEFLHSIFQRKYLIHSPKGKGMNPISNLENRGALDTSSQVLASEASNIIEKYSK